MYLTSCTMRKGKETRKSAKARLYTVGMDHVTSW